MPQIKNLDGYLYLDRFNHSNYCYTNQNDVIATRNISQQCISSDFSCAYGYAKHVQNVICEKINPDISNNKKLVCINNNNIDVDLNSIETVYHDDYYARNCFINITNPQSNKVCRHF
ncbi:hypothetical protein A3Q56_06537 [Intoshia linei]|uniref:Uncharacterized protein n=1 Tax=Intoshia linei TaxID=1819745 RepID=A0A177AW19_9BILA|nr:hypothetical protein A3Q56_06537 [Intoshia linei]